MGLAFRFEFLRKLRRGTEVATAVGEVVDTCRVGDRRCEVVFDGENGDAVLAIDVIEEGIDLGLALGVDAGGGFVEDEELRVPEEGAGDGDLLALPAGEIADTSMTEFMHTHGFKSSLDGIGGELLDFAIVIEQLLNGDREAAVLVLESLGDVADGGALDLDGSVSGAEDAEDEVHQGALATPVIADDGDVVAALDLKVELMENPGRLVRPGIAEIVNGDHSLSSHRMDATQMRIIRIC